MDKEAFGERNRAMIPREALVILTALIGKSWCTLFAACSKTRYNASSPDPEGSTSAMNAS